MYVYACLHAYSHLCKRPLQMFGKVKPILSIQIRLDQFLHQPPYSLRIIHQERPDRFTLGRALWTTKSSICRVGASYRLLGKPDLLNLNMPLAISGFQETSATVPSITTHKQQFFAENSSSEQQGLSPTDKLIH